jgi:hypothetical protein
MDMSEAEMQRLERRHADIYKLGAAAPDREALKRERQMRMSAFASKHGLKCFKCGSGITDWAKTGISAGKRPWAICVRCVRNKKERPAG